MICLKHFQPIAFMSHNEANDKVFNLPTKSSDKSSVIYNNAGLSSLLIFGFLALIDDLELSFAPATLPFIEELFKLFIQAYINIVKNQE